MGRSRCAILILLLMMVACSGASGESHGARRVALDWLVNHDGVAADVLVVRLAPGEERANLGFKGGDTVFLLDYAREYEYWHVSRPDLTYLFMKDLSFNEARSEARLEVELIQGDHRTSEMLYLKKSDGTWEVESADPVG